jgi:sensor c-di-GMP phosphodiesterase-like protein
MKGYPAVRSGRVMCFSCGTLFALFVLMNGLIFALEIMAADSANPTLINSTISLFRFVLTVALPIATLFTLYAVGRFLWDKRRHSTRQAIAQALGRRKFV